MGSLLFVVVAACCCCLCFDCDARIIPGAARESAALFVCLPIGSASLVVSGKVRCVKGQARQGDVGSGQGQRQLASYACMEHAP